MSVSTCPPLRQNPLRRLGWRPTVVVIAALFAAISMAGILTSPPANAAVVSLAQCNNQGPGPGGATTVMRCDITVVNTINHGLRSSVVTVTRTCALDLCTGSSSQSFTDVVTSINQCNGSDNDAAHPIICNVSVTNRISADTPGAQPVTAATVNQCVGSGSILCTPNPANTTNATVTQCNGSGTGGGGAVHCTVPGSTISPAIPIQINQCNGTGNPGGTIVTCSASLNTIITSGVVATTAPATTAPTTAPSAGSTAAGTLGSPVTPGGTGTTGTGTGPTGTGPNGTVGTTGTTGISGSDTTVPQVAFVPTGAVATGGGSTAGLQHVLLLTISMGLLLVAGFTALLGRRFTRRS
jgi:hypothetical protein